MDRTDSLMDEEMLQQQGGRDRTGRVRDYDPPAVSPSYLRLANRLSLRRPPLAVALGDAAIGFRPAGFGSIAGAVPIAERVSFWFRLDQQPVVLQMAKGLYERLLAKVDPELLQAEMDQDLLPLLLESCLEDSLGAAETALQSRLELVAIETGASVDTPGVDVALDITVDGEAAGRASLRAARSDVERMAALFEACPRPARPLGDLAVTLSFRAGTVWLNLGELRRLKVGDVVMAEKPVARWERMAATVGERWLLPLELTRAGPKLRQPMREAGPQDQDEWMMVEQRERQGVGAGPEGLPNPEGGDARQRTTSRQGPTGAAGEAGRDQASPSPSPEGHRPMADDAGPMATPADATFDELPIKVVFELGQLDMPLGKLQEIGPGHVFQLERPLGEAVEIHAGNRRIGQGEVVRIDDQVGVRMLRLFGQNQA